MGYIVRVVGKQRSVSMLIFMSPLKGIERSMMHDDMMSKG